MTSRSNPALDATLITSQLDPADWHAVIGDATVADAIRDRLVHGAHRLVLRGESLRKVQGGLDPRRQVEEMTAALASLRSGCSLARIPELLAQGTPDGAFEPIEETRKTVSELKRRNRQERKGGQRSLLALIAAENASDYGALAGRVGALDAIEGRRVARRLRVAEGRGAVEPMTRAVLLQVRDDPVRVSHAVREQTARLARLYGCLHWHLEFPAVFATNGGRGETGGGFDVVVGNPRWERVKLQEKGWFAGAAPISRAPRRAAEKLTHLLTCNCSSLGIVKSR